MASAGVTLGQDVEKGATVFKKCAICHKIGLRRHESGGAPNSTALTAAIQAVLLASIIPKPQKFCHRLNEQTFEDYIKDPKAKIPGTKMVFAGIKNEQEAKDLWAYLKQFDARGNKK